LCISSITNKKQKEQTMDYKFRLKKQIHGCFASVSSLDVMLHKDIQLPFPPSVGIEVSIGDICEVIDSIWVNIDKKEVTLFTQSNEEISDYELHGDRAGYIARPIDEIVEEYTDLGWEVENG